MQWKKNYLNNTSKKIHLFHDGNGRPSKILFANDKMMNLIDETENIKMMESQKI